ncbi:MAG: hypothetical protein ACLQNE_26880 [Thermoguttaceae bacterium]
MFMLVRKGVVQLLDMKSERGMVVSRSRDLLQSFARLPQHRRQNCAVAEIGTVEGETLGIHLDASLKHGATCVFTVEAIDGQGQVTGRMLKLPGVCE